MTITEKKIQVDKNGCKYILFRIDVFFTEYPLAVEIDEKVHSGRDLIFEEKRQKVKKAMMQTIKLVEYKHLSVHLKIDN